MSITKPDLAKVFGTAITVDKLHGTRSGFIYADSLDEFMQKIREFVGEHKKYHVTLLSREMYPILLKQQRTEK